MYLNQLTPDQINEARAWLNNQMAPYSGLTPDNGVATGRKTWAFNGDFNPYDVPTNDAQLLTGGQMAMGISDQNMAQILGMTPEDYTAYAKSIDPKALAYNAQGFANDFGNLADPNMMQGINSYLDGTTPAGGTNVAPTGGGGGGAGSGNDFSWSKNPYIGGMGDALTRQVTNTLQDQWLPSIRDNAVAAGGLGGSRQGVAQGLAIGRASDALTGGLANLYGTTYESEQNRGLQQQSIDNNFYTQQRGQDLTSLGLGAELWNMGMTGPLDSLSKASNIYGGVGNQNSTSTSNSDSGGGWGGALGGGLLGYNLWSKLK